MNPVDHFRNALLRECGTNPDQRLVLALSGGPDSTAMARIAIQAGLPPARLVAAHFDHQIRAESQSDAEFVLDLAAELGIEAVIGRRDVPRAARKLGLGIEAAARRLRYRFLERTARAVGASLVFTAHHQDDQAETLLLRLLRGTGVPGLVGIRESRPIRAGSEVRLARPLLTCSRLRLAGWLSTTASSFVVDPSNEDGSNRRSLVRTRLIPELTSELPNLSPRLAALARSARRLRRHWIDCADRLIDSQGLSVNLPAHGALPPSILRERLLGLLPAGGPPLDRRAMGRLQATLLRGHGDVDLGLGWTAAVTNAGSELALLSPHYPTPPESGPMQLSCPGATSICDWGHVRARFVVDQEPRSDPKVEVIDAGRCPPPYVVRFATANDRFHPLGLDGSPRVFRFLMARKVPRRVRSVTPVVLDEEGVVWVVGHRIADRAKLRTGTTRQVELTCLPSTPSRPPRHPS